MIMDEYIQMAKDRAAVVGEDDADGVGGGELADCCEGGRCVGA